MLKLEELEFPPKPPNLFGLVWLKADDPPPKFPEALEFLLNWDSEFPKISILIKRLSSA